jgi:hypothetical protein
MKMCQRNPHLMKGVRVTAARSLELRDDGIKMTARYDPKRCIARHLRVQAGGRGGPWG